MEPSNLSVKDAFAIAGRLKVTVWLSLLAALGTLVTTAFGAGRWWERTFGHPSSDTTQSSDEVAESTTSATARSLADRLSSRRKHNVAKIEPTLNEVRWRDIPPQRFGYLTSGGDNVGAERATRGIDPDTRNTFLLEVHKMENDKYWGLGYLSSTEARQLALDKVNPVLHLYTLPNDEAHTFVDDVPLERFVIADARTVGDWGRVFDLRLRPSEASDSLPQTNEVLQRR